MIQIIIEGNSGELRVNMEALGLLTEKEYKYLRELGEELGRRQNNDRI